MKPIHRVVPHVFADYHQFYVWDPELSGRMAPVQYTDEDIERRIKIGPGLIVICPVRNMTVPVEVSLWENEPSILHAEWQHIAIAPLEVPSGTIQIDECTGSPQAELSVPCGQYTVRCLFKGLDTLSANGLEGRDFYAVQIWPGVVDGLHILKAWDEDSGVN